MDIRTIYLALVKSLITHGILGWGRVDNNLFTQLQTCQNIVFRISSKIYFKYPTKQLFE